MIPIFFQVALGGAIGATARWGLGLWVARVAGPGMPLGVLSANVLGSLAMGLFMGLAAARGWGSFSPFVATGVLGGFTTFSSFSREAIELIEAGQAGTAILYIALSVGAGLGALYLGLTLARAMA
ncbi:fluoride efflux transporter CrcB [Palleronia caenipelagi]|uniref:Fluoride-specific ion channel FluC n=1 Tax=Palleronia caenipelagi TaxID=2489174 RepID=A0A547Q9Y9_9RHOB|nr:fluoride efflux transporter CrcB [Palleronia caenipelagi]TRD23182.1 fluoride efflux transporter CrcB [Palleronia caenipelagi]